MFILVNKIPIKTKYGTNPFNFRHLILLYVNHFDIFSITSTGVILFMFLSL